MWGELPDKARIETTREKEGQLETSIEVVNGTEEWKRFEDGTVEKGSAKRSRVSEIHRLPTEFQRHFGRGLLRECFAALTLEAIGKIQVAGRDCLQLRANIAPGGLLWSHWFSFEAKEFELAADVERAVILAIVGLVDGQPVDTHEVLEVWFDEEIDGATFIYEPREGEIVRPATPVVERMTLQAAAARALFTVLQPTYLPDRDRVHEEAMYHPVRPGNSHESLTVFYRGDSRFNSLHISQRGEKEKELQEDLEWDELVVEGRTLKISDPEMEDGSRVLACDQSGTYVTITSDLPREEMVKIALSLTPVGETNEGVE